MISNATNWNPLLENDTIDALNEALINGRGKELIQLSEVFHEHQLACISDMIASRSEVKLILIAGPSSSGKTTTSKRIAFHLRTLGINPVVVELDNYFVDRDKTPLDEKGEYDYESINAIDVAFINEQLTDLFAGKEVEMPTYNFHTGYREFRGNTLKMNKNDVIIMEGIHGLNPLLTASIPDAQKFRIYASILTSLTIENEKVTANDTRLLRRMVRDNQFRGESPAATILRWKSVQAGEQKYIFPFKEYADAQFNSALVYELPLLKSYADNLLRSVKDDSPAYSEARRLLKFIMMHVVALTPKEVSKIPPTSIVREFIGGSSISY